MGRAKSVHTSEIYHSTDIQPHNNEKLIVSQRQQFKVTTNQAAGKTRKGSVEYLRRENESNYFEMRANWGEG